MDHRQLSEELTTIAPICVYYCGSEQCRRGHRFGPAARNHHLLHFVAHGKGTLNNVHGEFHIGQNAGFYIAPGETTVYSTTINNPWEYYWVGFGGTDVKRLLALAGIASASPIFNCDFNKVKQIITELSQKQEYAASVQLSATGDMYRLFSVLCKSNAPKDGMYSGDDYVERALSYMREIAYYDISIEQISNYVGLNRSHLYRLVQAKTGKSLQQHLITFRMERAKELLQSTDYNISQIAAACGFNSMNHFSKLFKQRLQLSPGEYRKKYSGSIYLPQLE